MELRRIEVWEMVAAVVYHGHRHSPERPEPRGQYVGAAQEGPDLVRYALWQEMLDGMGVHGDDADGSGPLVVLLVVPAVKRTPVHQPVRC